MVPVMGRIAAGTPIEAIQTRMQTIAMPPDFLGGGDHFALEVRGDSMIEAGIHENDTVIIRKQDTAETGDIVVALIDGEEATLKRLRKRGASIALEAANPAYETRIFGPDRVQASRASWSACSGATDDIEVDDLERPNAQGQEVAGPTSLRRPLLRLLRTGRPHGPGRCGGPERPTRYSVFSWSRGASIVFAISPRSMTILSTAAEGNRNLLNGLVNLLFTFTVQG